MPKTEKQHQPGAPETLKWIADREAACRSEVERLDLALKQALDDQITRPPHKDGTDFEKVVAVASAQHRDAMDRWKQAADMVYKLDKSVEPSKRDASESITREEGGRVFSMFAIYMRTATESYLSRMIPALRETKSNEEAYAMAEPVFRECFVNAMKSAVGENHLPSWSKNAIEGVL